MKKNLFITLLLVLIALPTMAQKRDRQLMVSVTIDTGESLKGQQVSLVQTDYSLTYEKLTLDEQGRCTVKVYSGNHHITVERDGYNTAEKDFLVSTDEATTSVSLALSEKTRTPFALNAQLQHNAYNGNNAVLLTWNTEKPAFFDDFESYTPFATQFGDWSGIDGDELAAAPLTGDYANRGVKQYAQIINPLEVTPTWWYDYPVLRPYSGKQYVGFTRTSNGEANNDWLISPAITVGTDNVLTFMAKAADVYKEKFMVYVTTVTGNPTEADFVRIDKGNYESADDYSTWKQYCYDLSAYAGKQIKFAIRYVSEANNGGAFMLMVDNVYVGQPTSTGVKAKLASQRISPRRSAANPNETFEVYKDGLLVGTTDAYTYTLNDLQAGSYTLGVKAKYKAAESDIVTTVVDVPAEVYARLQFNVSANSILSADGQQINLINTATGEAYTLTVASGKAEMAALPVGNYIVNIEKGAFEEYQQELSVADDKVVDIVLVDNVLDPYNVTADLSSGDNGTTTAIMKWNQELAISDSFESYDDFATGSFGDWISLDEDNQPVYGISLNGYEIAFPGSGTQSNPKAIAPLVFNPWQTTPAMLPTDATMQAPTGNKYIVFFSPQRAQADKWLISPELDIHDGYAFTVTAKSYTDNYPESFEFAVSTTGTDPADFTPLSTAANIPGDVWTKYQTSLAAYAGQKVRVGIHYTSYDTFFAQLDDFVVGPESGETEFVDYGNIDHYNVYLDGTKVAETTTSTYTLNGLSVGSHTVGIQSVYKNGCSNITTYELVVTGISTLHGNTIPATAEFYNLSGQKLSGSFVSMPKGVYIVKSGNNIQKIRK